LFLKHIQPLDWRRRVNAREDARNVTTFLAQSQHNLGDDRILVERFGRNLVGVLLNDALFA